MPKHARASEVMVRLTDAGEEPESAIKDQRSRTRSAAVEVETA
jgi:hypothetical protein